MSSPSVSDYTVVRSKAKAFYDRYERKDELQHQTHYCPGCGHGIIHKMLASAIDELGIRTGPFSSASQLFRLRLLLHDVGMYRQRMGRAPQWAPPSSAAIPEVLWSYRGDGDLSAIGSAEIRHAATVAKHHPYSSTPFTA
jgi:2-oxoisovalerate ferredoxin oxidoreductase beta subunit